ncbi:MAG: ABC transporter permease [Candidatus Diapherotrites archaeon]|uniref:ABC transporter permease n=1 Tax=Candidatus Iainarchaeum sp. TaxID=3101447 RepID=A0A8T5GFS2_9ARCH|nr:ABC transporter permease [Candidatus Diapherotrites archaeon]MBT7241195.1 ABC transporter permease [Candidatus Diapherotrites archaeon]
MIDTTEEALKNLRRAGIRTFLTLIGIVIGIGAIVALLSVGAGVTQTFETQFESIGSNTIMVAPGDAFNLQANTTVKLTDNDIRNIKTISTVKDVIREYATPVAVEFNNEIKSSVLFTVDDEGFSFFTDTDFLTLAEGRWIEPGEKSSIMISEAMAENVFGREINLRKQLMINGKNYKVVGLFKLSAAMAGMAGGGGGFMFTTIEGFERIIPAENPVEMIVKTTSTDVAESTADEIKDYFEDKYGKKSVTVLTMEQSIEQIGSMLGMLTLFIVGIAGISLIVGGIGIMNAMVTSVMERTKEIGLYKAIGASDNKVLMIFLLEAAFIGLLGGLIGVGVGLAGAQLITAIANASNFPIQSVIIPEIIIGALAFSMIVGIASGVYPARRAAKLDPVEALRYE